MFASIVLAEDDVVDLADVGELRAPSIGNGALQVFLHFAQGVGQATLKRLQNAFALDVAVGALVVFGGAAVILLEQLAIDFHNLARRLFMAGQHGADHHHAGAEAHALGDVAMFADAAVGDDGFGRHSRAPLQRRELPSAGAEAGFHASDAHLARADAHLGRIGAPGFEIDHRLGGADIAGDDEGLRQLMFDVRNHAPHAVGMTVGDVDGDVVGARALGGELVDERLVVFLDAQRDRDEQIGIAHLAGEGRHVHIEAVHHIKVAIGRQPATDVGVDHGFHIGRHHRQAKAPPAKLGRRVALAAALHPALARQQQNVVVVEDVHHSLQKRRTLAARTKNRAARNSRPGDSF